MEKGQENTEGEEEGRGIEGEEEGWRKGWRKGGREERRGRMSLFQESTASSEC
jgi:hypothetical protein